MKKFVVLVICLTCFVGCSETAEEITAPEVMTEENPREKVEQFTATEKLEEESSKDKGLEPVIFVGDGPPPLWLLNADGKPCEMSYSEWLASPAGQMILGLKHIEDMGLGIDLGDGLPTPPDSSGNE